VTVHGGGGFTVSVYGQPALTHCVVRSVTTSVYVVVVVGDTSMHCVVSPPGAHR
jgi:hypothetical protein